MQLLKYKYLINNFMICLKSNRLFKQAVYQVNTSYQRNNFKFHHILLLVYNTINCRKESKQEQYRLNDLLNNYSFKKNKLNKKLTSKYLQIFAYKYSKSYKHTFKKDHNTYRSQLRTINIIALTYIYTIYKLIKSKQKIYTYGLLIMKRYKQ
jgi:hypothetical protein